VSHLRRSVAIVVNPPPHTHTHTHVLEAALSRGRVTAAARRQYTREKSLGLGKKERKSISPSPFSLKDICPFLFVLAPKAGHSKANIDCGQPGPSLCASRPHHRGLPTQKGWIQCPKPQCNHSSLLLCVEQKSLLWKESPKSF
jgi:hypothetical protein